MKVVAPAVFAIPLLGVVSLATLSGCGNPPASPPPPIKAIAASPPQPPWFKDVTAESGLDFVHDPGPVDGKYFMPQINGSGAALFDFDNDGRLDIYLLQFGGPDSKSKNALYRQLPDGKFENVSEGSGLDINGFNHGVAAGDVNNDGWVDVVVTQYLGIRFFLNQGNGTFQEATDEAGLKNPYWGASTSFVDYDRDGWLDLVVANYLDYDKDRPCASIGGKGDYCRAGLFGGTTTQLWRNLGTNPTGKWLGYENRSEYAGLAKKFGRALGVVCVDLNGDNWPDILVANDAEANHLWVNQKNGTFHEEAAFRGLAFDEQGGTPANMGIAIGDVDGNGLSDVFITHFFSEHHGLWRQVSRGIFEEFSIQAGLAQSRWHGTAWGTVLADFDQDGDLDLAFMNGFVQRPDAPSKSFWDDYKDRNQVFVNEGSGKFLDISADNSALCGGPNVGRGLCVGDIDGDGSLDLLTTQIGGPARILHNVALTRGHWLSIRAVDPALHRDAIGAEVRLQAGKHHWQRLIQPGQSFQCANDMRAHFGLGTTDRIDAIEVDWPDGSSEQFSCPGIDRLLEVRRGQGTDIKIEQEVP